MKSPVRPLLLAAATLVAASSAHAATQAWNTGGPTGNWNTTDTNWTGATAWTNGNDATFGGAGEAISINTTGITAHNLTFGGSGYTIGSSAPANTLTLTGTTPTIEVTNLADTATISSIIAGTAGLTKTGAGTLVLNANNTYTGETIISDNSGKVTLGDLGSLRTTSGITIGAGSTLELKATSTSGGALTAARDKLFSATNAGALVINGTLSNTGTAETRLNYASSITMNNGTILCSGGESTWGSFLVGANTTIAANGASNTISGTGNGIGISGGTLTFDTALATDALAVSAKLGASSAVAGAVQKTGLGTVTLSGTNTYTGKTTVSGGTLQLAKTASLVAGNWTAAKVTVASGATLALNVGGTGEFTSANVNTLLTAISVAGAGTGLQAGAKLGFDTTNATGGTFTQGNLIANSTGANGGAIGVTKLGTGTLVFDKANTYTGGTTIKAGTLNAANNSALGSGNGAVSVSGGTLAINAASVGQVTLGTGANLAMSSGKIAIDITGVSTFDNIVGAGTGQILLTGGTLELTGFFGFESGSYALFSGFAGTGNNVTGLNITGYDDTNWTASLGTNGVLSFQAVPEPSTYGLIGAGALAAVAMVRRRRKHAGLVA